MLQLLTSSQLAGISSDEPAGPAFCPFEPDFIVLVRAFYITGRGVSLTGTITCIVRDRDWSQSQSSYAAHSGPAAPESLFKLPQASFQG